MQDLTQAFAVTNGFKPASPPPPVMCMCKSTKPGVMTQPLASRTWMSSGRSRIALASASDRMPMMLPPADSCEATLRVRWAGTQACLTARFVLLSAVAHANRAKVPDALCTSSCAIPPAAPAQAHGRNSRCHSLVFTVLSRTRKKQIAIFQWRWGKHRLCAVHQRHLHLRPASFRHGGQTMLDGISQRD